MITSKAELDFFIKADRMMNRGYFTTPLKIRIKNLIVRDHIMDYLVALRKTAYCMNTGGFKKHPFAVFHALRMRNLGLKLGFSIGYNTIGYGVVISHYGTIVVGESNRIGNYAVLHTSICISGNGKTIGDGLYCSTGAKITSRCNLGNNVSVGANSVVNKDFPDNVMIAGAPAKVIKEAIAWYDRDGEFYQNKVNMIEDLKKQMGL